MRGLACTQTASYEMIGLGLGPGRADHRHANRCQGAEQQRARRRQGRTAQAEEGIMSFHEEYRALEDRSRAWLSSSRGGAVGGEVGGAGAIAAGCLGVVEGVVGAADQLGDGVEMFEDGDSG
jgi:3-oxoacyl-ACP reductase-like protein